MAKEIKLTVTFLNKTKVGKSVRTRESNVRYVYYGKSKTEAISKAKSAYHYGSAYKARFETVEE